MSDFFGRKMTFLVKNRSILTLFWRKNTKKDDFFQKKQVVSYFGRMTESCGQGYN